MEKYSVGYDLGIRPSKWYQKLFAFVWPPYRHKFSDKSAMVVFKHGKDGTYEMVTHKSF